MDKRLLLFAGLSLITVVLIGILAFGLVSRKAKKHEFEHVTINSIISTLSYTESLKVTEEISGVSRKAGIKGIVRQFPKQLIVPIGVIAPRVSNIFGLNVTNFEPLFLVEEDLKDRFILKIAQGEDKPLSNQFSFRLDYELGGIFLDTEHGKFLLFKQIANNSTSILNASVILNKNQFDVSALKAWIDLAEFVQVKAGTAEAFLPKQDLESLSIENKANETVITSKRILKPYESITLMVPIL